MITKSSSYRKSVRAAFADYGKGKRCSFVSRIHRPCHAMQALYLLNPLAPLAITPPSMMISAPVKKPRRSSNSIVNSAAISSGLPLRFSAEYLMNTSDCPLSSAPMGVSKLPGVTLRQRTFLAPNRAASVLANQITKCLLMQWRRTLFHQ